MERYGNPGPEVTSGRDSGPEPEPESPAAHALGPLEFDRGDLVYYSTCSCGRRFGPMAAVASLQAAFEHHARTVGQPGEPLGPTAG